MRKTINEYDVSKDLHVQILQKAAQEAFTEAAQKTMKLMGYNVVALDGWVVKLFEDGKIEKIAKI